MKIALHSHRQYEGVGEALAGLDDAIVAAHEKRLGTNWVRPAPVRQALTALALGVEKKSPFEGVPQLAGAEERHAERAYYNKRKALGERFGSWFRGMAIKAVGQMRQVNVPSQVHIARADSYDDDLAAVVQMQYEHFRATVPLAGKRVVLKPNLVEYHRDKVINTNPRVVAAVIELCKQRRGEGDHRRRGAGPLAQRRISGRRQRPGRCAQGA